MTVFPLFDEQKYIFEANESLKGITCSISFEIKFSKYFSPDELRFAIEKCMLSADISGARCVVSDGRPYMEFLPPHKPEIKASRFATDDEYQLFCQSITETEIDNRDKLYNVFIYAVGESFNNIHFCFNHLIFDGISGILLYYKIQKVLLDNHEMVSWHPFSAYLEKIDRYAGSEKYYSDQKFWENRFLELSTCECIFPDVIDVSEVRAGNLKFQTSKHFKRELLDYCARNNIAPHLLILAVLAELISDRSGCKRFFLEVPIGNRLGKKEKDSLGIYEIALPFIFDFRANPDLEEVLYSVKKQSKDYYKHKDFDWISSTQSAAYEEKYGCYIPQILYSYFCFDRNFALDIATVHHFYPKITDLPITLYISDYFEFETFSFYYVFWDSYFSCEEIIEIQGDLEARLVKLLEKDRGRTIAP